MTHYWTYAHVLRDEENTVSFIVELKHNCRFMLNGCYFTIKKELFEKYPESDYFVIDLITDRDKNGAESIIRKAIDLLVFIIGVPYEMDYLYQNSESTIDPIDVNISKKKIELLNQIDFQYGKIRKKKELLETVLRLYAMAVEYMLLFDDSEEAYFAMFRLIEKIAKDEFGIECTEIDNGYADIRSMTSNIICNSYGIKMPINKLDKIAGDFTATLFETVFSDVYSKIAWFCEKKRIDYDEVVLARAVKLRNKLAHGDRVEINSSMDEYGLLTKLSNAFIHKKFFDCIENCYIKAKVID